MNIRNPLALALLMTASAASASPAPGTNQPLPTFNFGATASPFSMTAGANTTSDLDDQTFNCTSQDNLHIPWASCTAQQLKDRARFNGVCSPKSQACKDYMQRTLSGTNPAGTIAAYTPPPGSEWASPDCTHFPCRTKGSPGGEVEEIVVTGRRSPPPSSNYEDDPNFVGPRLPREQAPPAAFSANSAPPAPPPMTEKEYQKTLADMKGTYGDKVVDLGNKTYGVLDEKGDGMSICGPSGCSRGRQSEHQDAIQKARAEANAFTGTSGGGTSNPPKSGGQTAGGPPPSQDDDSGGSRSPRGMGAAFAGETGIASSGSGGSGYSASGASGGGSEGKTEVIKDSNGIKLNREFTYIKTAEIDRQIETEAKAFAKGQPGFAAPNEPLPGAVGDPPISPEHLGKIQAVANGEK